MKTATLTLRGLNRRPAEVIRTCERLGSVRIFLECPESPQVERLLKRLHSKDSSWDATPSGLSTAVPESSLNSED